MDTPPPRPNSLWTWERIGLAAALVFEIAAYALVRWLDWRLDSTIHWVSAAFLIALPWILILALIIKNRLRFGMRSLLFFMLCIALFCGWTLLPYWRLQQSREGVSRLKQVGARAEPRPYLLPYLFFGTQPPDWYDRVGEVPQEVPIPFWLRPFVRASMKTSKDSDIREIVLDNEEQWNVFLANYDRFTQLEAISVVSVNAERAARLSALMKDRTRIRCICFEATKEPETMWKLIQEHRIPTVWVVIDEKKSDEPQLPPQLSEWDFLSGIVLATSRRVNPSLNSDDALTLKKCRQLRYLKTNGLRMEPVGMYQKALPETFIQFW